MSKTGKVRFFPGQVVATPGALEVIHASGEPAYDFLMRHLTGDWGNLDDADRRENELSVREGFWILQDFGGELIGTAQGTFRPTRKFFEN